MKDPKKIAQVVVIVLVIIGSIWCGVWMMSRSRRAPEWTNDIKYERIDENTLELMTLPAGQWESLGEKGKKYKNPDTGTFTMVPVMTCPSCAEKIPTPYIRPKDVPRDPQGLQAIMQEEQDAMDRYVCPKCGKPVQAKSPR